MTLPTPNLWQRRVLILLGILLLELLALTNWLDGAALADRTGLAGQIGHLGAYTLRFLVGFAAAFSAFAGLAGNWKSLAGVVPQLDWRWCAAHVASGGAFVLASAALYGNWPTATPDLLAAIWIALGLLSLMSACLAAFPVAFWRRLFRVPLSTWIASVAVAGGGVAMVAFSQSLWQSAALLTFQLVQLILRPVLPELIVQPEINRLQGHHFGVRIAQECSGLEGAGLMLVFGVAWLWLYRADFRFPRALLLIPSGVVVLFLLNAVRIAALLLLGDAGAERIAAGGFHSQAGWIAFNGVAFGMTVIAPRLRWFASRPAQPARSDPSAENPTATYLLPFLAILAAGMLSRAASADFEWLYGIRFAAALGVLWAFRTQLRQLDWRCGPLGLVTGFAVFGLWIAMDQWQGIPAASMPASLAASSTAIRTWWILLRAAAAVVTVPIAEELAFRGFGMRRLVSEEFEAVPFRSVPLGAVLLSSLAFGFLHGDRWIAGTLAGVAFAWVAKRTDRIGDAVAAHAVANALLAALVLTTGQWQYW